MAQQIDFISLSQQAFNNLVTANTVKSSRIYFTNDTHRIYKGADLYAATQFDTLTFSTLEASSITVDGKSVVLYGDVTGGTSYKTTNGVTVSVTVAANTAQPTITFTGVGAAASKSVVTASASMTTTYGAYLPTVTAVKSYVDATKASKGTATAAAFKGLRASVSMNSNTAPTMAFYNDSIVTVSTNIANNTANDKFITASAVAAYVDGKMAGGGTVVGGTSNDTDVGVFVSISVDGNATPYIDVSVNALTSMDDSSIYSDSLVTASAIAQYINNKVSAAIESALGVVLSSQY